jgi:hypothetical protein
METHQPQNEELRRLRAEAEELLEDQNASQTDPASKQEAPIVKEQK